MISGPKFFDLFLEIPIPFLHDPPLAIPNELLFLESTLILKHEVLDFRVVEFDADFIFVEGLEGLMEVAYLGLERLDLGYEVQVRVFCVVFQLLLFNLVV